MSQATDNYIFEIKVALIAIVAVFLLFLFLWFWKGYGSKE